MATLRSFPVVVEVWGWDEAFIGAQTDDPEALAHDLRQAVLTTTQLSCSIGIGDTRLQAKTATGFAKPAGVAMLTSRGVASGDGRPAGRGDLGDRVEDGAASRRRRHRDGARAGRRRPGATWPVRFGPTIGPHLWHLGRGGTVRPVVDEPWVAALAKP